MTTATTKTARTAEPPKVAAHPEAHRPRGRRIGREIAAMAVGVYEREVANVAAIEKDAAKVIRLPWLRSALTLSAELTEDVGAAYVKTARQALR
jgi:hypothetical protein